MATNLINGNSRVPWNTLIMTGIRVTCTTCVNCGYLGLHYINSFHGDAPQSAWLKIFHLHFQFRLVTGPLSEAPGNWLHSRINQNIRIFSSGSNDWVMWSCEKHEIYAGAFGGHLFYDLFSQGQGGGHGPLAPPPDPLLIFSCENPQMSTHWLVAPTFQ